VRQPNSLITAAAQAAGVVRFVEKVQGKERGMTVRRFVLVLGAVALVVGIIGLLVPVSVSDSNGGSLGCGNAVISDLSSARKANNNSVASIPILNQILPHTDFVAECQSALSSRRSWTIPVTVVGAIAIVAALFVRGGLSSARHV
jgi:preprotein translocase subunit Sec61beta